MGATNAHHQTKVSGISIWSAKRKGARLEPVIGPGTLTGLATRNSDGKKFLVTNLHVMTGSGKINPSGGEEMYQESVSANKKVGAIPPWDPDKPAWVPIVDGQNNIADVAMCELDAGVDAQFTMHDHPNHTSRYIIEGVVEPRKGMTLTMLGARNGEGTVIVKDVNEIDEIGDRIYTGMVILDSSQRPNAGGDSGAPYLFEVAPNRYRMACIHNAGNGPTGWAFPASVAERELGITFGNRAPTATASADQVVSPGALVTLDGSGSTDPEGDTLTYSWLQMFGSGWEAMEPRAGVTLNDATVAKPTFTAPSIATTLTVTLTVTDSLGQTATDKVNIMVNSPPVAVAADMPGTVNAGETVTLDASGSSDPDLGDTLTYLWEQDFGSARAAIATLDGVTLSDSDAVRPTFTAPPHATTLTFKLTVTDTGGNIATDSVAVTVQAPETWGAWTSASTYQGSSASRKRRQERVSSRGNRQYRWVSDPEATPWADTGSYSGCGASRTKEQRRTNSAGVAETRSVSAPEALRWGGVDGHGKEERASRGPGEGADQELSLWGHFYPVGIRPRT